MYNVNLDVFQGPLDLLLHLIEKMEIDIYNIPIAKLTESYLDYINNNDEFSLENAEEYIVMAATLIHIKSKSLLPVFNDDEQDIVEDDLVQQLIEYKNYKELSQKLEALHQSRAQYLEKESIDIETEVDLRNLNISSNKLLHAMENILKTFSKQKLGYIRNTLFAKKGYIFTKNLEYANYFSKKSWYQGRYNTDNLLNKEEQKFVEIIRKYEK